MAVDTIDAPTAAEVAAVVPEVFARIRACGCGWALDGRPDPNPGLSWRGSDPGRHAPGLTDLIADLPDRLGPAHVQTLVDECARARRDIVWAIDDRHAAGTGSAANSTDGGPGECWVLLDELKKELDDLFAWRARCGAPGVVIDWDQEEFRPAGGHIPLSPRVGVTAAPVYRNGVFIGFISKAPGCLWAPQGLLVRYSEPEHAADALAAATVGGAR